MSWMRAIWSVRLPKKLEGRLDMNCKERRQSPLASTLANVPSSHYYVCRWNCPSMESWSQGENTAVERVASSDHIAGTLTLLADWMLHLKNTVQLRRCYCAPVWIRLSETTLVMDIPASESLPA